MAKFNPLDPLGLFQERNGTQAERIVQTRYDVSQQGVKSARQVLNTLWPPPDPLGLFGPRKTGQNSPSGATIGNPIPFEWNGHLVDVKNQAREVLVGKGYPAQRVDLALHWAEEWLAGMAKRMAPGNTDLQKSVVRSGYEEIANRAEKWLQGIEAAFGKAAVK